MGAIYFELLRSIERAGYDVFRQRVRVGRPRQAMIAGVHVAESDGGIQMTSPDVIVIGAGVAGLRAAVELAARGARVTVLEAKAVLGGRATAFTDPQTGERVDNGQHVMLGCYHETFAFLRQIGTEDRVRVQPGLEVDFVDRAGERSRLSLPGLPPPLNFAAGLLDWKALAWRDRLAAMRLAGPIRTAQAEQRAESRGQTPTRIAASPGETVDEWLINNGQTARIREMLWEPLALAALNQSVRVAAAPPFAAVLARDVRRRTARRVARVADVAARSALRGAGAAIHRGSAAERCASDAPPGFTSNDGRVSHVEARGERLEAGAVVAAVPWYALSDLFAGDVAPVEALRAAAAATRPSPIASVNLWLNRRMSADAVSRPAGANDAVGIRQGADVRDRDVASHPRIERRR